MTTSRGPAAGAPDLDLAIARLLATGALVSVVLMAIGVGLMAIRGIDPLTTNVPGFDLAHLSADLLALRPEGFLELGLIVVIAMPASRVAASLIGYARRRERSMVLISIVILAVIALSVVLGASSA
jgi:uncharacterized membrane protein